MAPARGPTFPTYQKDEKALCFHHEFLYEAKVLDSRHSDPSDKNSPLQYRVHYKGWKSTWDDWVPQDRLRKLTEENKQLATNLKREIDEMNPRTAAKSGKATKKKNAGSDLSSARGSEERQSLPPGRSLKRGRDNEIEKVGSSLSSNVPPVRRSPRTKKPPKDLGSLESPEGKKLRTKSINQSIDVPNASSTTPHQLDKSLPVDITNVSPIIPEQSEQPLPCDVTNIAPTILDQLEQSLLTLESFAPTEDLEDIDIEFWMKEASSLDHMRKNVLNTSPAQFGTLETDQPTPHNKLPPPRKGSRVEKYTPLAQLSESAFQQRVLKMTRHREKIFSKGAEAPWPNGPPKGPERHRKWEYTRHVDSHNHMKLYFYSEIKPTDHPVIAGYAPENPPPDLGQQPKSSLPPKKRRKVTIEKSTNDIHMKEITFEQRRTRSISSRERKKPQSSVQDDSRTSSIPEPDQQGPKDMLVDGSQLYGSPSRIEKSSPDFGLLKQRLEVEDSEAEEDETNEHLEQEEHFYARPAVKIDIPDHLKAILVDDWENVTKNLSLVPIPADHPVTEILDTYFEEEKGKRRLGSAEADLLEEVVQGTRDYFDQCLGKLLLYRFEREQYFRLHKAMEAGDEEFEGRPLKDKKIADIYGAEHLCRLFVSLPELIAQTNMDAQAVSKLRQEIQALTAWLGKNSTRFFTAQYEAAPQEYVEKAKGL